MAKRMIKATLHGAVAGVALNAVAALTVSYWLRLGYYMPCLASLPEQVGGELNAALLQMLVAAAAGAAVGALWQLGKRWAQRHAGARPTAQRGATLLRKAPGHHAAPGNAGGIL